MFPNTPLMIDTSSRKSRRFSAPEQTPTSATFAVVDQEWEGVDKKAKDEEEEEWWDRDSEREEEEEFEKEKKAITSSRSVVHEKRRNMNIRVDNNNAKDANCDSKPSTRPPSFFRTSLQTLTTIPSKPLFVFALAIAALSGLMTPVFSFLLSLLLFEVSLGGTNTKVINQFGGILLLICAFDGPFFGAKYMLMEIVSIPWVTDVRNKALCWRRTRADASEKTTNAHSHTTQPHPDTH